MAGEHQQPIMEKEEGEERQEVVSGWEKVDFEETSGTKKAEEGGDEKLHCDSSDSDSKSGSDSASKSDSASMSDSDSDSKSGSDAGTSTLEGTKRTRGKGMKEKLSKKMVEKEKNKGFVDHEGDTEGYNLLEKLQCHSDSDSKSGSDSGSKSGSDSGSKSGSETGSSNLKEKKRTKKIKTKGWNEKIKEKLSRKKTGKKDKKIDLVTKVELNKDEAQEVDEGVKAEKPSLLTNLQCDGSNSDSKSASDSDSGSKSGSDSASKSGSGNGSKTLKEKRSKRTRKMRTLKEKSSKKNVIPTKLIANEDEARETTETGKGEKEKISLLNKLHCDSSNSGSDSGSSSEKGEAKGQGEKVKKKKKEIRKKIEEKFSIQNTNEKDEKNTMVDHEMAKETITTGENTTIVVDKLEEPAKVEKSLEEEKSFLEKVKGKLSADYKKPIEEGVFAKSTEPDCDIHVSNEKKGIIEKIMEKLPSYHKNKDANEKMTTTN